MAAVAITFAKYFLEVGHLSGSDRNAAIVAVIALTALTLINCLGVRAGSTTQNVFMILKLIAIAVLVAWGLTVSSPTPSESINIVAESSANGWLVLTAFGAALIPVQFAYGGWQTSCFVAGEVRDPQRNLPRGLLFGVLGVIAVYLSVNFVYLHALGAAGLAQTKTPASAVMRMALGERGARFIAIGIAVSTLGFLSQSMLTAPRVYFAMAQDRVFFQGLARLNRARVPAFAIALQGVLAIVIALSGKYEQILNYVVSVDVIFFALTAMCVFLFRARARRRQTEGAATFRIPGHPFTTLFFILACGAVVLSTINRYPRNSAIGLGLMLAGLPVYFLWSRRSNNHD
jgi:APA family basic amino acid/polyamine antiporter